MRGAARVAAVLLAVSLGLGASACRGRGRYRSMTPNRIAAQPGVRPDQVYVALLGQARALGYLIDQDDRTLFFSMPSLQDPTHAYLRQGRAYRGGSRFDIQVYADASWEVRPFADNPRRVAREHDWLLPQLHAAVQRLAPAMAPGYTPPPAYTPAPAAAPAPTSATGLGAPQ